MMEPKPITVDVLNQFTQPDSTQVEHTLNEELSRSTAKVVVLDDDPTGVQTVHGVPVYTNWDPDTLLEALQEPGRMFFILTNSRGMTAEVTAAEHERMAYAIHAAAQAADRPYILISRSDSTLRGHYPLETQTLRHTLEELGEKPFDGEIIYPFFMEGGRYTLNNIHYVQEGEQLIPAGLTEFAKDKSFGYKASSLPEWCVEKSGGTVCAQDITCISLQNLCTCSYDEIERQLMAVHDFGKVIVNSISYENVKVFSIVLLRAISKGKRFLLRSAAAVTKVLGGVPDKPLLTHKELILPGDRNGGIVIVGSHVNKTTRQLEQLRKSICPLEFIQFDQHLVLEEGGLEREVARVVALAQQHITLGRSVVVFTRRDRLDLDTDEKDRQLEVSVRISDALTSVIEKLTARPAFIIAKGGITSSDVGTKALGVRRAIVMGQIRPGIPVWLTGPESKFPGMPYVIFPGNVGMENTLLEVVEVLMEE